MTSSELLGLMLDNITLIDSELKCTYFKSGLNLRNGTSGVVDTPLFRKAG